MHYILAPILTILIATLQAAEPWIIAHRGASHDAPENTLPAFELAWKQGADGIEGDFHLTADKKIVCIHDFDTKRVSGEKLIISQTNLADLQRLDVGSWKSPQWKDVRMPTLDDVLKTVPEKKKIFIEIKSNQEIIPFLIESLKKSNLPREQIVIISFNQKVISTIREQAPDLVANWLTAFHNKSPLSPSVDEIGKTLMQLRASGIGIQADARVDHPFAQNILQQGHGLHVWTVDDGTIAKRFRAMGVASITTNRPAWLRTQLDQGKGAP